jgi:protein-S-isoprenylcysteine O-methyltransferase Ste14
MMEIILVSIGLVFALGTLATILWSIVCPSQRIWPPESYTLATPVLVWVPTFTIFGVLLVLGVMEWGTIALPNWMRFGLGIPLIVIGNIVVWSEVAHFGIAQTGGAKGTLRIDGMYRYSRNPQYVADIAIVSGWILLCASAWVAVVGIAGLAALIAAPFAEEPWLKEQYGHEYEDYLARVRRFF